ncbi:MAG: NUDIX domain-containing protein [Anaerolineales bacterium]|nr:NUDIX domain-containing protein [Anaerolineales bacterium]
MTRPRAGIILIEDGKLALMERHKQGRHYFAFPGGGVDEGETEEQAAVREAYEELGVHVEVVGLAAEVLREGRRKQVYFLVRRTGGEFGTGTGEEYDEPDEINGTYHPMWMPLEDVVKENVVPRELAELVVRSHRERWGKSVTIHEG